MASLVNASTPKSLCLQLADGKIESGISNSLSNKQGHEKSVSKNVFASVSSSLEHQLRPNGGKENAFRWSAAYSAFCDFFPGAADKELPRYNPDMETEIRDDAWYRSHNVSCSRCGGSILATPSANQCGLECAGCRQFLHTKCYESGHAPFAEEDSLPSECDLNSDEHSDQPSSNTSKSNKHHQNTHCHTTEPNRRPGVPLTPAQRALTAPFFHSEACRALADELSKFVSRSALQGPKLLSDGRTTLSLVDLSRYRPQPLPATFQSVRERLRRKYPKQYDWIQRQRALLKLTRSLAHFSPSSTTKSGSTLPPSSSSLSPSLPFFNTLIQGLAIPKSLAPSLIPGSNGSNDSSSSFLLAPPPRHPALLSACVPVKEGADLKREKEDLEAITAIVGRGLALYKEPWSMAKATEGDLAVLLREGGENLPVAGALLRFHGSDHAALLFSGVAPRQEGRGYARLLLEEVEKLAHDAGAQRLVTRMVVGRCRDWTVRGLQEDSLSSEIEDTEDPEYLAAAPGVEKLRLKWQKKVERGRGDLKWLETAELREARQRAKEEEEEREEKEREKEEKEKEREEERRVKEVMAAGRGVGVVEGAMESKTATGRKDKGKEREADEKKRNNVIKDRNNNDSKGRGKNSKVDAKENMSSSSEAFTDSEASSASSSSSSAQSSNGDDEDSSEQEDKRKASQGKMTTKKKAASNKAVELERKKKEAAEAAFAKRKEEEKEKAEKLKKQQEQRQKEREKERAKNKSQGVGNLGDLDHVIGFEMYEPPAPINRYGFRALNGTEAAEMRRRWSVFRPTASEAKVWEAQVLVVKDLAKKSS
eukprot:CAMPEP_0175074542 /NCGR_PEP_ID=MMETSP0052_2-20121109/21383_1 /TAXON_ID=51329 ORGANISM="Polytomella parva, Strain SAG 63-3" /NCGR_SAMPLE_ID=MMETSP0052_2 /ASSEMBLY_ACC=CAM_ASM_000194 /LENGTH=820 /DNA_ID=CAMNT_0016342889 /DNA_START=87 /DNA_END=2549 /DNA_ORIENTATION=+